MSLASALSKISVGNAHARASSLTTNPSTAHLFICVILLKGEGLMALFFDSSSHHGERIKRLEAMAGVSSSHQTPQVIY